MSIEPAHSRRAFLSAGSLAITGVFLTVDTQARAQTSEIRVNLNENAHGPSPAVARAIATASTDLQRYVEQAEVDALVAQIAEHERVRPDQVVLGELLEALGLFLARRRPGGGGIVHSTPGYAALVDAAAPLGGRGVPVPLAADGRNDLPALERGIDGNTLAVSLIAPHNPTGTLDDRASFDAFVLTAARRTLVVIDEAYLEYDDLPGRSGVRFVRQGANVLVFRTLAKAYGLAGLPMGYALTTPALAASLRGAGIGTPHSFARSALAAASAALRDQPHIARVRAANASERARLTAALDRLRLPHTDSRANFLFFQPRSVVTARAAFTAANIRIARAFPPLTDQLRITVGTRSENDAIIAVLRGLG